MSPKLVSVLPLLKLRYELKVNPDSAFNVSAVPEPVIILLSALLFIVVLVTVANVESPLRNVEELAVPDPNLAVGTVPDPKFDAFRAVNADPSPLNDVAVKAPDDELKVRFVPVFGGKLPVAAVTNVGKQVVSDDSSATVT